jgi:hypothetical protein
VDHPLLAVHLSDLALTALRQRAQQQCTKTMSDEQTAHYYRETTSSWR